MAGLMSLEYGLLAGAGFLAGVINTIAGGGSFLTLPLLMELGGLPVGVANATNRIGILFQNVTSVATFHRGGQRDYRVGFKLMAPMILGAGGGAWLALSIDDATLRPLFGALMMAWALYLLLSPGKFDTPDGGPRQPSASMLVMAMLVGAYGGFVQAGVGFPLMAMLVLGLRFPPVRANGLKVLLVLGFTAVGALPVFLLGGEIAWAHAFALALGTTVGGYAGTRWQLAAGPQLVRVMVVVMVALSGLVMLVRS